jgi:hypothetical protein
MIADAAASCHRRDDPDRVSNPDTLSITPTETSLHVDKLSVGLQLGKVSKLGSQPVRYSVNPQYNLIWYTA